MTGDFQATIGAPDVFVPAGDEYGLPDTPVFVGTTVSPFGERQPCGLEGPRRFLLPPGELVYSLFTVPVEEASVPVSGEDG
jgi:hypothetical protein